MYGLLMMGTVPAMPEAGKPGEPSPAFPPAARFVEPGIGPHELLDRLEREDALAVPALTGGYRAWLLEEAYAVRFREARPVVGRASVPSASAWACTTASGLPAVFTISPGRTRRCGTPWLAPMNPCPFESRLVFNDRMLQVYEPGETGITPHMDRTAYRNLICLFVLEGRGRFGVCPDRSGRGARIVAHEPGDVVLTRAPGFRGSGRRPFHFVDRITERRYVFGLRHERAEG